MNPFTIVGMPGSGKSAVSSALAEKYGMTVISTDAVIFKEARQNPAHPVTTRYLAGFEQAYGKKLNDPALLTDMPGFIAAHSEKAFRDLEEQAVVYAFGTGRLKGAIPDLSGSGFMRPAIRQALKDHGVVSVYLEVPDALILKNLMKDYEDSLRTGKIKRSGYFHIAKTAADKGSDPAAALDEYSKAQRPIRAPHYALADIIINVADGDGLQAVIDKVEAALKECVRDAA
jgi:shikimate kinase